MLELLYKMLRHAKSKLRRYLSSRHTKIHLSFAREILTRYSKNVFYLKHDYRPHLSSILKMFRS